MSFQGWHRFQRCHVLTLHWGLAAWHGGIKSLQPLALSKASSFYSEGPYPFSNRIIEVVQVLLGYYTLTFVPTLRWMQAFPGHLSECLWHTLTPACAVPGPSQSPSPQTSPAKHQKTKAASPLPVPKCSRLGRSEFSSHGQPCSCTLRIPPLQGSCLLPPRRDRTRLLPYTVHLPPHHRNACSAFTSLLTSKFTARKAATPKSHGLELELSLN